MRSKSVSKHVKASTDASPGGLVDPGAVSPQESPDEDPFSSLFLKRRYAWGKPGKADSSTRPQRKQMVRGRRRRSRLALAAANDPELS